MRIMRSFFWPFIDSGSERNPRTKSTYYPGVLFLAIFNVCIHRHPSDHASNTCRGPPATVVAISTNLNWHFLNAKFTIEAEQIPSRLEWRGLPLAVNVVPELRWPRRVLTQIRAAVPLRRTWTPLLSSQPTSVLTTTAISCCVPIINNGGRWHTVVVVDVQVWALAHTRHDTGWTRVPITYLEIRVFSWRCAPFIDQWACSAGKHPLST